MEKENSHLNWNVQVTTKDFVWMRFFRENVAFRAKDRFPEKTIPREI